MSQRLLITANVSLVCGHRVGTVPALVPKITSQWWVRVEGHRVLVEDDPEHQVILLCPNYGVGIKPCTSALPVQKGYSDFLRIDGKPVCLDTLSGLTDGTPPGTVTYEVNDPGQTLVSVQAEG